MKCRNCKKEAKEFYTLNNNTGIYCKECLNKKVGKNEIMKRY